MHNTECLGSSPFSAFWQKSIIIAILFAGKSIIIAILFAKQIKAEAFNQTVRWNAFTLVNTTLNQEVFEVVMLTFLETAIISPGYFHFDDPRVRKNW